jgi:hypothetical protein
VTIKKEGDFPNLHIALMHYPVYNKHGKIISSAISGLDLHDIARAAKTYSVRSFAVVTPLKDQQELADRIVAHWTNGFGATYNPNRKEALALVRVKNSLQEVIDDIANSGQGAPKTVITDAKPHPNGIGYKTLAQMFKDGAPYLLLFGTAWGLTTEFIDKADYILSPIVGKGSYNHLSVRSAAAIILDRLLGIN